MSKSKKTRKKIFYVVPYALLWGIRRDGVKKVLGFFSDKHEAISYAKDWAQKIEAKLIIYNKKDYSIAQTINYAKKEKPATKRKLASRKKAAA